MENKITFAQSALDDLNDIATYIFANSKSLEVTIKFINELREFTKEMLEKFPMSGFYPKNRSLRALGYRYLVFDNYLIFYLIKDNEIRVNAIINSKQDYFRYNNF